MKIKIPIEIIELEDASYHLMVSATFNNNTTGNLIIDTGASKTVFDYHFIAPFAIDLAEVTKTQSSGINAMIANAHTCSIASFKLDALKIDNLECILLDLSHINELYQQYTSKLIAGLIGSDFLLKYKAVIDYSKKQLELTFKNK